MYILYNIYIYIYIYIYIIYYTQVIILITIQFNITLLRILHWQIPGGSITAVVLVVPTIVALVALLALSSRGTMILVLMINAFAFAVAGAAPI
jgi:hypothetical protein